ncbi:hypothetical protein Tco_1353201 [Tanacetum coccineum]
MQNTITNITPTDDITSEKMQNTNEGHNGLFTLNFDCIFGPSPQGFYSDLNCSIFLSFCARTRQLKTEFMLEKKFRDLCKEMSNFVKESEDMVQEFKRLSGNDVAKETVHLLRRGQKRDVYKMTRHQMMVNESHLSVCEKHYRLYLQ